METRRVLVAPLLAAYACLLLIDCRGAADRKPAKVVRIALDGAAWQVARPPMRVGRLPTFSRLVREGVSGTAESVTRPHRYEFAPLWTTVATGRHPDGHGILADAMGGETPTSNIPRQGDLAQAQAFFARSNPAFVTTADS